MTTDLDAVRAALAAATPGPWDTEAVWHLTAPTKIDGIAFPRERQEAQEQIAADADLIAHAPEWLAALADEVETLRKKLARVEALADDYRHLSPGGFHGADAARELRDALTD